MVTTQYGNGLNIINREEIEDMKKEKNKRNIFLALSIIFLILTIIGAILVFTKRVDNAGYAVIPMLWSLIFGGFMRASQQKINENSKK